MPTLTNTPTPLQNLFPPITHINPDIEEEITNVIRDSFYYYCFCNKIIHTFTNTPITILSIYANKSSYLTSFYVVGKFCCSDCNKEYYFFIPLIYSHDTTMGELQIAPASAHLITPVNALENLITFTHKHLPTFTTSSLLHSSINNLLTTYLTYTYYKHLPTFTTKQYHLFSDLITSTCHVGETLYEADLFKTLTTSEKETANLINDVLSGSYLHPSSTNLLLHLLTLLPTCNIQYTPLTSLVSLDTFHI